ncbi:hypothetical protein AB0N05_15440 [Nocardia sp. NPDC051030]|uniref:hypothetical protein n=1 Tax=Nocardia sp. NPDC051030 TaxID=3155162 RepID=UPI00343A55C5
MSGDIALVTEIGVTAVLIYLATVRANKRYRIQCGECGYRTPWLSDVEARDARERHRARRHPVGVPSDDVEVTAP